MDLVKMTIAEIKEYAKDNNIDLSGIKTKTEMIGVILKTNSTISEQKPPENLIGSEKIVTEKRVPLSSTSVINNNAIGSMPAEKSFKKIVVEQDKKEDKYAIFSSKNISWIGLGKISKGYNIVTKEEAEKWLTRSGVREATPEEVASYYGL